MSLRPCLLRVPLPPEGAPGAGRGAPAPASGPEVGLVLAAFGGEDQCQASRVC